MNPWLNNRGAGDLRRHRAHYDVTVMNEKDTSMFVTIWNRLFCVICYHTMVETHPIGMMRCFLGIVIKYEMALPH